MVCRSVVVCGSGVVCGSVWCYMIVSGGGICVWWCVNILNRCGGDDDGAGSAVPFPILDRFGPN